MILIFKGLGWDVDQDLPGSENNCTDEPEAQRLPGLWVNWRNSWETRVTVSVCATIQRWSKWKDDKELKSYSNIATYMLHRSAKLFFFQIKTRKCMLATSASARFRKLQHNATHQEKDRAHKVLQNAYKNGGVALWVKPGNLRKPQP